MTSRVSSKRAAESGFLGIVLPQAPKLTTIITQTIRERGVSGLYSGAGALIAGNALKAGVRFMTYDSIKALLVDHDGKLSSVNGMLGESGDETVAEARNRSDLRTWVPEAGLGAGVCEAVIAVTPSETVK